jgi:phosphoribosylformylglycinamidine synthase II
MTTPVAPTLIGDALLTAARKAGLTPDEVERAKKLIGRTPNTVELGLFGAMWSEHCSYKSSRHLLSRLPTKGKRVLVGPGENAGVVDIGDGLAVCFKMESHNHPSYIEPYQGAATGVGGILRDVFTMGARPIALMDALRFGSEKHWKTRKLLNGVTAGIAGYGNAMGVPVVGGDVAFDETYDGNILVNVLALGLVGKERIFLASAEGVGNPILYVGARTGRDGIRGATMASASFGAGSDELRPTVQVGDPFFEKLLLECCLELFRTDSIVGIQDMGAAGLVSSSSEMASRGGLGVKLQLDQVPVREEGMSAEDIMLSESQERMLLVAQSGREQVVIDICRKWDLDVAIIGEVTDSGRLDLYEGEVLVASLPATALTDDAPKYDRPRQKPANLEARWITIDPPLLADAGEAIVSMLARPTVASKRWIYEQFDHMVRVGTLVRPGRGDAAVVRVPGTSKAVAIAVDGSNRFCGLDPKRGAMLTVMACARNLACVGAEPLAVTDCLNFGDPTLPEVSWQLAECIDGIAAACNALDVPVVSGNVSLYNDTDGVSIDPTPMIGMAGLIENAERTTDVAFKANGDRILLLGKLTGELGGSEFLASRGRKEGRPPALDEILERSVQTAVRTMIREGFVASAHDCSEGGLAVALAESCLAGALGAAVKLDTPLAPSALLFSEEPSRVIVSCSPERVADVLRTARKIGAPCVEIGTVGGTALAIEGVASVPLEIMRTAYEGTLPRIAGES